VLPWKTLDRAKTADGGELTLALRGEQYAIRISGQNLMSSESHDSEEQLAVHGCEGLAGQSGVRVLVGGLGMGFTVRAALDAVGADAEVEVVELVSAVVPWNRDALAHLAGAPGERNDRADDARVGDLGALGAHRELRELLVERHVASAELGHHRLHARHVAAIERKSDGA